MSKGDICNKLRKMNSKTLIQRCVLFFSRNVGFTCMWFTVRTNPSRSTSSLSTSRLTLRWGFLCYTWWWFPAHFKPLFRSHDRTSGSSWVTGCSSTTCSSNQFSGSWSISSCWRFDVQRDTFYLCSTKLQIHMKRLDSVKWDLTKGSALRTRLETFSRAALHSEVDV